MHIELRPWVRAARPASSLLLAGLLLVLQPPAQAQAQAASVVTPASVDATLPAQAVDRLPEASADASTDLAPLTEASSRVGDSTQRLLALQRSGQLASPVPRPVPGEIAQRSRERYLKSFEREIPERFQSSVSQKADGR